MKYVSKIGIQNLEDDIKKLYVWFESKNRDLYCADTVSSKIKGSKTDEAVSSSSEGWSNLEKKMFVSILIFIK